MMLALVSLRSVNPNLAGHLDVAGPHQPNFTRSHPGQPLQFDHRPDLRRNERQHGIDKGIGNRLHRISLVSLTPSGFQPSDGLQAMKHARRNEFILRPPAKARADFLDVSIHDPA